MIETKNLRLIPCERRHLEAFAESTMALGNVLGVAIPADWPTFPEAFTITEETPQTLPVEWPSLLFLHPAESMLVGNGGFVPPNQAGQVEIGYEIAPAFWNRGYATEALRGMLRYAFSRPGVQGVIAHTMAEENASVSVLKKVGMIFDGELPDDEVGAVWRWRLDRASYAG